MNTEIIEKIMQHLADIAPEDWESISLRCDIDEDLCQFNSTYCSASAENLHLDADFELADYFRKLHELTQSGQEPFKQAHLKLMSGGKYTIEFGYDRLPWE